MSVAKGEKIGFLARLKRNYRGVTGELKKVHWPNKKELVSYTGVVLVSVVLVSIAIWVVDSVVGRVMQMLIK